MHTKAILLALGLGLAQVSSASAQGVTAQSIVAAATRSCNPVSGANSCALAIEAAVRELKALGLSQAALDAALGNLAASTVQAASASGLNLERLGGALNVVAQAVDNGVIYGLVRDLVLAVESGAGLGGIVASLSSPG